MRTAENSFIFMHSHTMELLPPGRDKAVPVWEESVGDMRDVRRTK